MMASGIAAEMFEYITNDLALIVIYVYMDLVKQLVVLQF